MRDIFKNYEEEKKNKKKRRRTVKSCDGNRCSGSCRSRDVADDTSGYRNAEYATLRKEEHTHTDACYTNQLTCGKEETGGHQHTDACYKTERF